MKKFLCSLSLGLAVALAWSLPAMAVCTISTTPVSYGSYNVFSAAPLDSTGTVTYRCGNERNITITLNEGGAATFNPRRMLKGSEALNYNLYRDAARTTLWGDGTSGTQVYSDANPPNNQNVTVNIFGRIPAGQDVTAGSYTNTITATINF